MDINALIGEIKRRRDIEEVVHHHELPPREARYGKTTRPLSQEVTAALSAMGIEKLYDHQARGIDIIRDGANLVAMTPTSSGKSLIYNIPVIESLLADERSRALYIYPLKGLEQDQLKALREFTGRIEALSEINTEVDSIGKRRRFSPGLVEIYDGDTSSYRRSRIRENPPAVLMTNPDMLHLGINAFHTKWQEFLRNLKYVIIDEVHTYRGVFGSHVANVIRRLRRIAAIYGADPQFIACSATIANPAELAGMLTGLEFEVVGGSGAPQGRRHFLFVNPPPTVSHYTAATKVFSLAVGSGLKTIAFTKARKITELMYRWVRDSSPELADRISSYRAGFLPEERRAIEQRLFSGELSGVISTSALELGVDIGGLDVCVLVGYPGTITSTLQRSGRAGRSGRDSLVVLIAQKDALDQYFMRHPEDFFRRSVEAAVLDHENRDILKSHLMCAVAEANLDSSDRFFNVGNYEPVLRELEAEEKVRHWRKGEVWYPRTRTPHRDVSIRQTGYPYTILTDTGKVLGQSGSSRVLRELHPGAVYLHKGMQWKVEKLDMGSKDVVCRPADDLLYYTRPISHEETEILDVEETREFNNFTISVGRLRVTETVLGYRKKHLHTDQELGEYPLKLPPSIFTTVGVWMRVDEGILDMVRAEGYDVDGGLHATEHAAIAALPLFALCDRMDLGGVSYPFNQELESAAIFIYDGHEGGVGLTRRGFETVTDWFESTARLMAECECEVACPSCTQDQHCGNNNEPLDKRAALVILNKWLELR